jgi:hypothetical protein
MLFHRDKNILVVATKLQTATNLVKKVKAIIKNLPDWMRISDIKLITEHPLNLRMDPRLKVPPLLETPAVLKHLSLLVVDEAAHVEKLDELWTALYPTLSTGGRCIALSTPNGVGNWFHQNCVEAEAGTNDFHMTTLMWDVHPDRDKNGLKKKPRTCPSARLHRSLSATSMFPAKRLSTQMTFSGTLESLAPEYRTGFDRNYWIWKKYDPEKSLIWSWPTLPAATAKTTVLFIYLN